MTDQDPRSQSGSAVQVNPCVAFTLAEDQPLLRINGAAGTRVALHGVHVRTGPPGLLYMLRLWWALRRWHRVQRAHAAGPRLPR